MTGRESAASSDGPRTLKGSLSTIGLDVGSDLVNAVVEGTVHSCSDLSPFSPTKSPKSSPISFPDVSVNSCS